jgi:hypothetical protein
VTTPLTSKQASDLLRSHPENYTTPEQLRALAAEVNADAPGKLTILYSGEVAKGVYSNDIIEGMVAAGEDVRVINKSEAAKFLQSNAFKNATADAFGITVKDLDDRDYRGPAKDWLYNAKEGPWADASGRFADTTVGEVRVIGNRASPDRVFGATEVPHVLANSKVPSVEGIPREKLLEAQATRGNQAPFEMIVARSQENVGKIRIAMDTDGLPIKEKDNLLVDSRTYLADTPGITTQTPKFPQPTVSLDTVLPPPSDHALAGKVHLDSLRLSPTATEIPVAEAKPAGFVPEISPTTAGKVLGVGGVALMGYDAYKTTEQYQALSARGNHFGADALLHQYEGRTAGGVVGSIGAGMAYGFVAGSESGPGALLTGAVGGVAGAFAGDKIATAYNEYKVNHQAGTDGVTYTYANGNWVVPHANVDWSHPTPEGFPGLALSTTKAPAEQLPTLDYKRTTAVTELALANPATQNTKTITLDNTEWHASRDGWTKDVQVTLAGMPQADDFGRPITMDEKADAKTGAQLDQIAANRQYNNAHYTEAVSQAYVMDYYGKGWNKVGPLPEAITQELKLPSETQIKDPKTGFTWTADGNGQFSRKETTVGYDTPVTETVKASGEELARVSNLQKEAVQSNASYGSQLIAQKYEQLQAPAQQQAPVQPTPASHPGQAASTADPTKTAQAPVANPSPEFQSLSAKLQNLAKVMESGDTAALRKEAEPYTNSPQGQAISTQAKANVQREDPSREQQRDPRDAGHPDYALNKDIRTQVESLYTRSGIYPTDKTLDHVTAAVALNAREQGITHVDQLQFNTDKSSVIAVQNANSQDMFSKSSATNIQQAMQTAPEHSYQQMAQVTQQQAQTQQNIQQQIAQSRQQPQQGPSLG